MALIATRLTVTDPEELLATASEHDGLRRSYGCTGLRFLRDYADPTKILALMEFPTLAVAFNYIQAASHIDMLANPGALGSRAEYYEDL